MTSKNNCRIAKNFSIILTIIFFSHTAFAALSIEPDKATKQIIKQRITPIGKVCQAGEPCAANAQTFATTDNKGKGRTGEQVYNTKCAACHATGLLNAPKIGDKTTWQAKLDTAGSFDKLLKNAINGIGAMPAKGTCTDCSTDEIEQAIGYMGSIKR